jgi:hypothetical protein
MVSITHSTDVAGTNNAGYAVSVNAWNDEHVVKGILQSANDRAELAAANTGDPCQLTQAEHSGLFVFDSSNLSAKVTADTAQGIYVAPSSDVTGAAGAWVRQFSGPVNPQWFGLVGDDNPASAAANTAAFEAMLATLEVRFGSRAETILVPSASGAYYFGPNSLSGDAGIELTFPINLEFANAPGSIGDAVFKFEAGIDGIIVQNVQGIGSYGKLSSPRSLNALFSTIRNARLEGAYSGTEGEFHGIRCRTKCVIDNATIKGFEGDGIHLAAQLPANDLDNPPYGNVNYTVIFRPTVSRCRNGIFLDGNNANACNVFSPNITTCRQWGIWDSSFIGNSYFGGHIATNGIDTDNDGITKPATIVEQGGNWYGVIADQEAGASTNAPPATATNNTWWYYIKAGAAGNGKPTWFSGINVRAGGCIRNDNDSAYSVFSGIYVELNHGKAQIVQHSLVLGGLLSAWVFQNPAATTGTSLISSGVNGRIEVGPTIAALSGTVTAQLGAGGGNSNNVGLEISEPTYAPSGWEWFIASGGTNTLGDLLLSYNHNTGIGTFVHQITGPSTPITFGRSAIQPNCIYMPRLFLGTSQLNARQLTIEAAAPTTIHGVGDWTLARDNNIQRIGWKTTAAGTPGTQSEIYGLTSLTVTTSGLVTTATDKLLGRSTAGAGAVEEIACTAAGRAILDDADATAQRTTLGLGTVATANVSAAAADLTTTATVGTLPTANGTMTIADATTPTVSELLEYCRELEAQIETLKANMRTSGLLAA